ncbi:MAG: sugar phosphate isomerase/epimerase [Bryobacteraceae bacterium]|nr:sugar phosphate isomerase/epimerase [Bryobacteraceae bacterium]
MGDPQKRFLCLFNLATFDDLPGFSSPPADRSLEAVAEAGYDGVQLVVAPEAGILRKCRDLGFYVAGSGRVNKPAEVHVLGRNLADSGLPCATLHVGWGMEDSDEAHALIEAVLEASVRFQIALWPETHRATIFQDLWRTVQFLKRYPALMLNGDFSHWYTGLELVYGGFANKLHYMQPVLERIRFLHGRIGNPGCIQVAIREDAQEDHVSHFQTMWTSAMEGFLRHADPSTVLLFATELLSPRIFYARSFPTATGEVKEESDRWEQSLLLCRMARASWQKATLNLDS